MGRLPEILMAAITGVGVLAMIFLPFLVPTRGNDGSAMSTMKVAGCAQREFRETGKWPETVGLQDACLQHRPGRRAYFLNVVRLEARADSAVYRIRLNGYDEVWRVDGKGRPTKVHSEG
ncbi:MAG: hypothetical protein ACO1SV_20305 [Fimbriimonas sp.]